jgi:hypothetical protein
VQVATHCPVVTQPHTVAPQPMQLEVHCPVAAQKNGDATGHAHAWLWHVMLPEHTAQAPPPVPHAPVVLPS